MSTYESPGISALATAPAFAAAVAEWFPELGGRSVAVSESDITEQNIPILPLAMIAIGSETSDHNQKSNRKPTISEEILLQFWLRPDKYRRADGSESPFFGYVDTTAIRNKLLTHILDWIAPSGYKLRYRSMDIDASPLALVITFRLIHEFVWCESRETHDDCGRSIEPQVCRVAVDIKPAPTVFCGVDQTDKCDDCNAQTVSFSEP